MTKIKIIFVLILLSQQLISSTAEEFFLGVKYNSVSEKNEIYNDFYSNGNNFALEKLLGKKNSVIKI